MTKTASLNGCVSRLRISPFRSTQVFDRSCMLLLTLSRLFPSLDAAQHFLTRQPRDSNTVGQSCEIDCLPKTCLQHPWRAPVCPETRSQADLVEEVMRIHGINEIKAAALPRLGDVNAKILTTLQIRSRLAKRALASRGMLEAVTWSFIPAEHAALFGGGAGQERAGVEQRALLGWPAASTWSPWSSASRAAAMRCRARSPPRLSEASVIRHCRAGPARPARS